MARQAKMVIADFEAYIPKLKYHTLADITAICGLFAITPRGEFEPAFPPLSVLLDALSARKRGAAPQMAQDRYQQQVCPKCGSMVAMMRPVGEQFRTWCLGCQSYRKIYPADMDLSDAQWAFIVRGLDAIYRGWVERGSQYRERIDPQFDREVARQYA